MLMQMIIRFGLIVAIMAAIPFTSHAQRQEVYLKKGWSFTRDTGGSNAQWQAVTVPHDWAISGPFDVHNDLQIVAVEQNGETEKSLKTGRTGGLPFIGKGTYRTTFQMPDILGKTATLIFDGAMSHARVQVNGQEVITWPYGYNAFYVNLDGVVKSGSNTLQVNLENFNKQSRWYAGAGLYRHVHLMITNKVHIPTWGTYITTPYVSKQYASVDLKLSIAGTTKGKLVKIRTDIEDALGQIVATQTNVHACHGKDASQRFIINHPHLWSPDTPYLYTAKTRLFVDNKEVDTYSTRFGVRRLDYIPEKGFFLNGEVTKFKGVCIHHDLGPLGAAINKSALRYRLTQLKDMGANAIRTAHNMPSPELVALCDEMGMMLMIESFDDWSFRPKSANGYGALFDDWAEKDITNMVQQFRNNPSVVMWSIGNEVPSQWGPDGVTELHVLQDLVHTLDPTRPVTCGMDQIGAVLDNGFAAALDIPGFNYKPQYYEKAYKKLPQKLILGSETASTVSSRGIYHFPVIFRGQEAVLHEDNQCSSYDNENCYWSNIPELDFAMDEDKPYVIGQFVWTGFDYLGEPTPYDTNAWPSHSSSFGIIDLASIPKDRYYLYRSVWNKKSPTLHILPHWTWKGREGQITPIFVYTSYPKAELFINGKSQGIREKHNGSALNRYRLMWDKTVYEPGELRVIAYDKDGHKAEEKTIHTAGKAHRLMISTKRTSLQANGEDLLYLTVQVVDKHGHIVPTDTRAVQFTVQGAGTFHATANGDPTSLRSFQNPVMDLFSGAATAIVRAGDIPGKILFTASAKGLRKAHIEIEVKQTIEND